MTLTEAAWERKAARAQARQRAMFQAILRGDDPKPSAERWRPAHPACCGGRCPMCERDAEYESALAWWAIEARLAMLQDGRAPKKPRKRTLSRVERRLMRQFETPARLAH